MASDTVSALDLARRVLRTEAAAILGLVDRIDGEMAARAQAIGNAVGDEWAGLLEEGRAYIEMALEPEVQRIVLLDGPAVLGDPSQWPSQNSCLQVTIAKVERLLAEGRLKPVDPEAAARLLNGAALNAALWRNCSHSSNRRGSFMCASAAVGTAACSQSSPNSSPNPCGCLLE